MGREARQGAATRNKRKGREPDRLYIRLRGSARVSYDPRTGRSYYLVQVAGPPTPYPEVPGAAARGGDMVAISKPVYFNFAPSF
jgi:hypothetical protein